MIGKTITQVAAGILHSLLLADDGTVFSFGGNSVGATGQNTTSGNTLIATPIDTTNLAGNTGTQIDAGQTHSLLLALPTMVGLPSDYNDNHAVDAADYVVWRKLVGQTGASLAADGTGPSDQPDGVVDELDYDFWRTAFGNTPSTGSDTANSASQVPEPAAVTRASLARSLC